MLWACWHQSMSTYYQPSFSSSTWKRGGLWMCKLGVISQERLKIEVKLLLSVNGKSYRCRVDWHNNGWPWVNLNAIFRIARYLCVSWASCCFSFSSLRFLKFLAMNGKLHRLPVSFPVHENILLIDWLVDWLIDWFYIGFYSFSNFPR